MSFEFSGATAAQNARRRLSQAGIPSSLRKTFNRRIGCRFVVTVSAQNADAAAQILRGGRV